MKANARMRWLALYVLCLGDLMIVLDSTIVNVALPTIQEDLGFSDTDLAWVVNAYLLTFGGFLLLGGRLGDIFGHRRLFLIGTVLFTAASLICGIASTQVQLVIARAIQGLGGAIVSAVALSIVMMLFTTVADRAKAMGIFGFVLSGGGTVGVLLGGIITDLLSWHWIFLVNLPVGVAVYFLSRRLLPGDELDETEKGGLDLGGAITITLSLVLATYAIANGNETGWTSAETLSLLGLSAVMMGAFIAIEAKVKTPLVPLSIFRLRNLTTANLSGLFMAAGLFAAFFLVALYLGKILGYTPLQVGLAYVPMTLIWGFVSFKVSDRLVVRYGVKKPIIGGLLAFTLGLLLFARAPVDGSFWIDIFPAMILQGIGAGVAFNPILLAAMNDVKPQQSGLASGVVNTSFMMGGGLGLAILASIAASRTTNAEAAGLSQIAALNSGYQLAFLIAAAFTVIAVVITATLMRPIITAPDDIEGGEMSAFPESQQAG